MTMRALYLVPLFLLKLSASLQLHFPPACTIGPGHPQFLTCCDSLNSTYPYPSVCSINFVCEEDPVLGVTRLDMNGCGFVGAIPTAIVNMVNLTHLSLAYNLFNGTLPLKLSNLQNLSVLDLSTNELIGYAGIGMFHMNATYHLDLSHNRFQKLHPDVLALPKLEYLDLRDNQIADSLGHDTEDLKALRHLDLSNNYFTSTFTPYLTMPDLQFVNLANNDFSGSFPEFGQDLNLAIIDLRNNQFEGTIPTSYEKYSLLQLLLGDNPRVTCPVINYTGWATQSTDWNSSYGPTGMDHCTTPVNPVIRTTAAPAKGNKLDGVEIFLIILLIVFVCGLGFYCYRQHNDPSKYVTLAEDGTL